MEAIILAGGRGQRMDGLAKPFYKPLLELNGIPLLEHAIEYASAAQATHVHVVVSPSNIDDVHHAISKYGSWVTTVIQEFPFGPGHATILGLEAVKSDKTMLLMSDNIMDKDIVYQMGETTAELGCDAIGFRLVPFENAARFTRIRMTTAGLYLYVEGIELTDSDVWPGTNEVAVWCGPIVFDTQKALSILNRAFVNTHIVNDGSELKIGPHLDQILDIDVKLFDVNAMDVGVPADFFEQSARGGQ